MITIENLEHDISPFQQGDQLAFKAIFNFYYKQLCYFASGMIVSKEESKDIVSNVMGSLWKRRESFKELGQVKGFLFISTKNACINFLASSRHRKHVKSELSLVASEMPDEFLEGEIIKLDLLERIAQLIDAFPPQQKAVFTFFYHQNLTYEEIAQKMQLSPSSVRNHKSQAIGKLKFLFEQEAAAVSISLLLILLKQNLDYFF